VAQEGDTLMRLLAYCAARTVNGVKAPWNRDPKRLAHADTLAQAIGLDMTQHWEPTAESYLGRVTKFCILEAAREGVSERDAESISGLKKHEMADHAEQLLAGRRWVPAVLRTPETETTVESEISQSAKIAAE
jgi:ParB family transcriptional regulator, chromosome partitioning protein